MRRILVALSGLMLAEFLDRALGQLHWQDAELHLLHVVDTRPLAEFGLAAGALPARTGRAAEQMRAMGALGGEAGRRMLEEAEALVAARRAAGGAIRRLQRTGVPEHEIVAAAYEVGADLIVLGAAEEPAGPAPPGPGPRARFPHRRLTPTVRFVVDHAPCDVLLLYAGPRG